MIKEKELHMGDMADEFKALTAFNKEQKEKRYAKISKYLKDLERKELIELDILNSDQGHYRIYVSDKKIDVWVSTAKFTLVGTNKYNGGFKKLKDLINRFIDIN